MFTIDFTGKGDNVRSDNVSAAFGIATGKTL